MGYGQARRVRVIDLPRAMLIGIGQGGSPGACIQPRMVQLSHTAGQAAAYLLQRLRLAQLTEQHARKLIPARKPFGVPFSPMLTDYAPKPTTISTTYDLCKKVRTFERYMPPSFVRLS